MLFAKPNLKFWLMLSRKQMAIKDPIFIGVRSKHKSNIDIVKRKTVDNICIVFP